jgi:hypothetical protein
VYAAQDAQPINITATGGVWMYNTWSLPPIPTTSSIYYGNVVIGTDNHTTPPAGFVSNNVIGDGVQVGVAYGEVVPSGVMYTQYRKKTRGYFNLFACNSVGQRQFLRIPMDVLL